MVVLKVQIVGLEENAKFLNKLGALDFTKWFKGDATQIVYGRIQDIINKGVDRKRYDPLHPFTKENKTGGKVMVGTGRLMDSVTSQTADSIYKVDKTGLEIGSKLPYARIHNEGGKIRVTDKMRSYLHWRGLHLKAATDHITIPKRPYLFISKAMEHLLQNSLIQFIQRQIAEAGGKK